MDQRGRDAEKRYRNKTGDIVYKTISLILSEEVYIELEKAVNNEPEKNMSKYLEENISLKKIKKIDTKRPYRKEEIIKKTFTFSEEFAKKLKESGNMSLTVENILKKKFNL